MESTNPAAPRAAQAHTMLAGSMHTLPWLSATRQKTTQEVAVLDVTLYSQPRSHTNLPSRSHPADFGCPELAVSLRVCGCHSQGEHPMGLVPGWESAPGPPAASPAPGPSLAHPWAAQWEGRPRKSFGNICESHHRGLGLICGPPSNQGQVWDFSEVLK